MDHRAVQVRPRLSAALPLRLLRRPLLVPLPPLQGRALRVPIALCATLPQAPTGETMKTIYYVTRQVTEGELHPPPMGRGSSYSYGHHQGQDAYSQVLYDDDGSAVVTWTLHSVVPCGDRILCVWERTGHQSAPVQASADE